MHQYKSYDHVLHLQCVSGIHFNPLTELHNYEQPRVNETVTCQPVDVFYCREVSPCTFECDNFSCRFNDS